MLLALTPPNQAAPSMAEADKNAINSPFISKIQANLKNWAEISNVWLHLHQKLELNKEKSLTKRKMRLDHANEIMI